MLKYCCKGSNSTESLTSDIEGEPVYRRQQNAELIEGYTYLITGQIIANGDRFIIDFCVDNASKDIALRIAARASTNSLGRNCRINSKWDIEETSVATPINLVRGWNFEIQVFFSESHIFIALDSMHIAQYAHRIPFTDIKSMEIRGDIKDINIESKFTTNYPLRRKRTPHVSCLNDRYAETADTQDIETVTEGEGIKFKEREFLPLPYYAIFSRGFLTPGYSIIIKGHVSQEPVMFKVALQLSQTFWPPPTIAMQLVFRFSRRNADGPIEGYLALNTYAEDEWIGSVRCSSQPVLRAGSYFNLVIINTKTSYEVHLNNNHLYNYPHIIESKYVNTCLIEGDIKLIDVLIESD